MVVDLLALSPEFALLLSLAVMFLVNRFRESKTPKTFYTLSKFFLVVSGLLTLLFFDRGSFPEYWQNNTYTTLFKLCTVLLALTWFFLSCKWFLNKNRSSYAYYALGTGGIAALMMIVSACHLAVLFAGMLGLFLCNYFLMYQNGDDQEVEAAAGRYLKFSLFFLLLFAVGMFMLYPRTASLSYVDVYAFYAAQPQILWYDVLTYVLLMAPVLFMIGLAPFHFWFADIVSVSILPVSGFYTIIPLFAAFSSLVNLCMNVFFPLISGIKPVLWGFAVFSLLLGAVSANREKNLRRLFAYGTLYNLGFIFITLNAFNYDGIAASFVYLVVYMLSMLGVYTVFFGFKSNGEYLTVLDDAAGAFMQKPYIAVAFLVFMVSLASSPPTLGFLGKLAAVNNLVIEGSYCSVAIVMVALLLMITAYLDVIKAVFFDERKRKFDRADRGIYICLFLNILIVLISILNPSYLMDNLEKLLVPVL